MKIWCDMVFSTTIVTICVTICRVDLSSKQKSQTYAQTGSRVAPSLAAFLEDQDVCIPVANKSRGVSVATKLSGSKEINAFRIARQTSVSVMIMG